jgi:hypothetical protein
MVIKMAKAIDKSFYNKNIKVSQATINQIKKMGMKEAIALAKMYADQGTGYGAEGKDIRTAGRQFLNSETAEGIKRLYGNKRYTAATAKGGNAIKNAENAKKRAAAAKAKASGKPAGY